MMRGLRESRGGDFRSIRGKPLTVLTTASGNADRPLDRGWPLSAVVAVAATGAVALTLTPLNPTHAATDPLTVVQAAPMAAETYTGSAEPIAAYPSATTVEPPPPDLNALRLRGRVGDGLYESLLSTGLSSLTARQYLALLTRQPGIGGNISPDDHFDLVLSTGESGAEPAGTMLYAAIDRVGASDVRLVKLLQSGRANWIDANASQRPAPIWPVTGHITSGFGTRVHPILHFARRHQGIDFGARWGQPIVAAADGQVTRASWVGAYGRQVSIDHGGAMSTSYSHMSRTAVAPGSFVRAGQVIGYVGSTGLSTGPHLHYEVHRGGVPINPLSTRFAGFGAVDPRQAERVKARLAQFMALGPWTPPRG